MVLKTICVELVSYLNENDGGFAFIKYIYGELFSIFILWIIKLIQTVWQSTPPHSNDQHNQLKKRTNANVRENGLMDLMMCGDFFRAKHSHQTVKLQWNGKFLEICETNSRLNQYNIPFVLFCSMSLFFLWKYHRRVDVCCTLPYFITSSKIYMDIFFSSYSNSVGSCFLFTYSLILELWIWYWIVVNQTQDPHN